MGGEGVCVWGGGVHAAQQTGLNEIPLTLILMDSCVMLTHSRLCLHDNRDTFTDRLFFLNTKRNVFVQMR